MRTAADLEPLLEAKWLEPVVQVGVVAGVSRVMVVVVGVVVVRLPLIFVVMLRSTSAAAAKTTRIQNGQNG